VDVCIDDYDGDDVVAISYVAHVDMCVHIADCVVIVICVTVVVCAVVWYRLCC